VAKNMKVAPKLNSDEWSMVENALCYSSLDATCPPRHEIMLADRDQLLRAVERYEHYEIADCVAALKRKLACSH
jgi:hypothetical protein